MSMGYPVHRPRRLRRTAGLRRAFAETDLRPSRLIAPLFVKEGIKEPVPIASMPGQAQLDLASAVKEARELSSRGVGGLLVFGVPAQKSPDGSAAWAPDGISQLALAAIKDEVGDDLVVMADLCMCSYTESGHCGLITQQSSGRWTIDNDPTVELYGKIAVEQAQAGADIVAPSGMMDGQVHAIRAALDDAGFSETAILSYAAKFASSFYGPFRDAAEGAPQFGDRRSYQMHTANLAESLREAKLDVAEGADALMVKPAIGYLDVVRAIKDEFGLPTAAYNVSGEYSMLKAAASKGWLDERSTALEILESIRRAGADLIITYHAGDAAEWLS